MGAGTERGSWELLRPFLEEPGWAAIAVPAAGLWPSGGVAFSPPLGRGHAQPGFPIDSLSDSTAWSWAPAELGLVAALPESHLFQNVLWEVYHLPGLLCPSFSPSIFSLLSWETLFLPGSVSSLSTRSPGPGLNFVSSDFLGSRQLCPVVLARPWGADLVPVRLIALDPGLSGWLSRPVLWQGAFHMYLSFSKIYLIS